MPSNRSAGAQPDAIILARLAAAIEGGSCNARDNSTLGRSYKKS